MRCAAFDQPDTQVIDSGITATIVAGDDEEPSSLDTPSVSSPLQFLGVPTDSRLKQWKQGDPLGRGSYGEVFKVMVAGRFLAAKKIPLMKKAEKEIHSILLEINTLKRFNHPRIVRYHGCIVQDEPDPALVIFLEFMPAGSIKGVLGKFGPYGIHLVRKYTRQILEGLDFLHSQMVIHRDVKGANILIDLSGDAKIADFGACRELEALHTTITNGMKSIQGSIFWMAPEVVKHTAGRRSDIWSLGCTVIEMMTAEPPWGNLREEKLAPLLVLERIGEGPGLPPIPSTDSNSCRSFLESVLVRDYNERPYAGPLLKHRFIRDSSSRPQSGTNDPPSVGEAWGDRKSVV